MRLQKYLAASGVASRRAAEEIVRAGRVTLAGETVTDPARDVGEGDLVTVDGLTVAPAEEERVVLAVHKPAGVVSTASDPQGRRTVVSLVESGLRLYPVGRLDADTSGLILLTNDGALAHLLTHPRFGVPKTYRARVTRPPIRDAAVRALARGVVLEDGPTAPAQVRRLAHDMLELTLREGRKRQVRRMCDAVGHPVRRLERISIGPLVLGELREGRSRRLTGAEIDALRAAAGHPAAVRSAR